MINSTAPISRGKQAHLIFAFKCNPVQTTEQTLTFCREGGLCTSQGEPSVCPGPDEIQVTALPAGQICSGDALLGLSRKTSLKPHCRVSAVSLSPCNLPLKPKLPSTALIPDPCPCQCLPFPPWLPRIALSCCLSFPQQSWAPPDSLNWPMTGW